MVGSISLCLLSVCELPANWTSALKASLRFGDTFWEQESLTGDTLDFLLFHITCGTNVAFLSVPTQGWHVLGGTFLTVSRQSLEWFVACEARQDTPAYSISAGHRASPG